MIIDVSIIPFIASVVIAAYAAYLHRKQVDISSRQAESESRIRELQERLYLFQIAEKRDNIKNQDRAVLEVRFDFRETGRYRDRYVVVKNNGPSDAFDVNCHIRGENDTSRPVPRKSRFPIEVLKAGTDISTLVVITQGTGRYLEVELEWRDQVGHHEWNGRLYP